MDDRPRITSASEGGGKSSFILANVTSGDVVNVYKPPACSGLYSSTADRRPRRCDFTNLVPGEHITKIFEMNDVIWRLGLCDGIYEIELQSLGAWWCRGSLAEIFGDEEDYDERKKIPAERLTNHIPAAHLSCSDRVMVHIYDGKCSPVFSDRLLEVGN